MSTLLILKREVEEMKGSTMRMIFTGAAEAHLIAEQIGERCVVVRQAVLLTVHEGKAGVGVILNPARPFPTTWEDRRM